MSAAEALDSACALDKKTEHLAYLAVLRLTDGGPFHVMLAKGQAHPVRRSPALSSLAFRRGQCEGPCAAHRTRRVRPALISF
jgi:hypothetical protein